METPGQPNTSSTASLTHAAIQRLGQQSATCKLTSAILAGAAMLFASGAVAGERLLWAAAPMLLLALADASYAAKTRRLFDLAGQLDGAKAPKAGEVIQREVGNGSFGEALGSLKGLLSFSVWPYYTSLVLLMTCLASTILAPKPVPGPTYPSQPFANMPSQIQGRPVGQPSAVFPQGTQRPAFPTGPSVQSSSGATGQVPPVTLPQTPNRTINRFPPSGAGQPGGQAAPGAPLKPPAPPAGAAIKPPAPASTPTAPPAAATPAPQPPK